MFFNAFKHKNAMVATKGLIMSLYFTPKKIVQRWSIQKNKRVTTAYIKSILWDDLPQIRLDLENFENSLQEIDIIVNMNILLSDVIIRCND